MNKKEALAQVLEIDIEDIEVTVKKTAWFEVDIYRDIYNDEYYLVLDDAEYYYNSEMYGTDTMQEIDNNEYYIVKVI